MNAIVKLVTDDGRGCTDFNQPCAAFQTKPGSKCRTWRECIDERLQDEIAEACGLDCEIEAFGEPTKCALPESSVEELSQVRVFKRLVVKDGDWVGKKYRTAKVRQLGTKGLDSGAEGKSCSAFGDVVQGRDGSWYVSTSSECQVKNGGKQSCGDVVRDLGTQPPSVGDPGVLFEGRCRLEELTPDCPKTNCSIAWNILNSSQVANACKFSFTDQSWGQTGWDGFLSGTTRYTETGTLTKAQCGGTPCSESYAVVSDSGDTQTVSRTRDCPFDNSPFRLNHRSVLADAAVPYYTKFTNAHRDPDECYCVGGQWDSGKCRMNKGIEFAYRSSAHRMATNPRCKIFGYLPREWEANNKGWVSAGFQREYDTQALGWKTMEIDDYLLYSPTQNAFAWANYESNPNHITDQSWRGKRGIPIYENPTTWSQPNNEGHIFNGVQPPSIAAEPQGRLFTNTIKDNKGKLYWQYCSGGRWTQYERPGSMTTSYPALGPARPSSGDRKIFTDNLTDVNIVHPFTGLSRFPLKDPINADTSQVVQVDYRPRGQPGVERYCAVQTNAPLQYYLGGIAGGPSAKHARAALAAGLNTAFCGYFMIPNNATCDMFLNFSGK